MSAPLLFATLHALERLAPDAMPAPHRLLLLLLADFADDAGRAWPSKATLAARAGLAERTVDVALAELAAAGWLEREHRRADASSRNLTTVYTVKATGQAITRARSGRHGAPVDHGAPAAPTEGAPAAVGQGAHPAPAAPHGAPAAPTGRARGAGDGAPAAPERLKERLRVEPPRERSARAAGGVEVEQLKLEPSAPKPEAPIAVLWRVLRVRWAAKYRRKLVASGQDDAAVAALAKRGDAWCKSEGKTAPGDLELLFDWWAQKYLADPGSPGRAGEQGYLERTCHQPKDIERGLAAYGTPWDPPEARAAPRPNGGARPSTLQTGGTWRPKDAPP